MKSQLLCVDGSEDLRDQEPLSAWRGAKEPEGEKEEAMV